MLSFAISFDPDTKMKLIRKTRNPRTTLCNKSREEDTPPQLSPQTQKGGGQTTNRHKTYIVLLSVGENKEVREAESDGLEEKRVQNRQVERTKETQSEQERKFKNQY